MRIEAPFEILEIPASGAYGTVAVVRQIDRDGRVVAVKALRKSFLSRPRLMARARDEARMLFHLRHPNIVRVEELLDVGGRPILVMEWVEGVALSQLIGAMGSLPMPEAMAIARHTALALDTAYNTRNPDGTRMRIVHRDIKPANLLVSLGGEVKVVDFGVAHGDFFDREASTVNTVMGTQGFMAPERLDGVNDHPAIDVYALGITLFYALTGEMLVLPRTPRPHQDTLLERLEHIRKLPCPTCPGAPWGLADLIGRMCTWSHEKRIHISDVQMELSAMLVQCKPKPDMVGFALQHVVPIHASRPQIPPHEHADFADLAFLEQPWETLEVLEQEEREKVPTTFASTEPAADRRLRRLLRTSGWSKNHRELTWLLARNPGWTASPFIEVLDAASTPWWMFWKRRASVEDLAMALDMLRYRRSAGVLARARALVGHSDPRVVGAAERLLKNEE